MHSHCTTRKWCRIQFALTIAALALCCHANRAEAACGDYGVATKLHVTEDAPAVPARPMSPCHGKQCHKAPANVPVPPRIIPPRAFDSISLIENCRGCDLQLQAGIAPFAESLLPSRNHLRLLRPPRSLA